MTTSSLRLFVSSSLFLYTFLASASADPVHITFDSHNTLHRLALTDLDPSLVPDFSPYNFLVLEFKASSPERFELGFDTPAGNISKRIHPRPDVWVRASIPLDFYRHPPGNGVDLAATMNKPRASYWINIEHGGFGDLKDISAFTFNMPVPIGSPTLDIRSARLSKTDPGDAVLDSQPLVDSFGQYVHADWPGKAKTLDDLKRDWDAEAKELDGAHDTSRSKYGGFTATQAKATGFFQVEQIDGHWWFIDPDGHWFWSTGANGIAYSTGRGNGAYATNIRRRFGDDWQTPWARLTLLRMESWGLDTLSGTTPSLSAAEPRKPYVLMLRSWQTGPAIMNMPDVYAPDFAARVDAAAARQCTPLAADPWLIGYFIGNEPPWPGRESMLCDLILAGPKTEIQSRLKAYLATEDTLPRRRSFVVDAFKLYLFTICVAVKKYDPNHLNLGIRFGGSPPDDVIACASVFDVYSHNIYAYAPQPERLDKFYRLTGRPILIGEFHIGAPERGMAPGLVQAANQDARGVAYQYYIEHAAAHPAVIGAHWFEWLDEPALGRMDGENYNIGMVDVTDRPYAPLVAAMKVTHARLLDLHSGKVPPTDQLPAGKEPED